MRFFLYHTNTITTTRMFLLLANAILLYLSMDSIKRSNLSCLTTIAIISILDTVAEAIANAISLSNESSSMNASTNFEHYRHPMAELNPSPDHCAPYHVHHHFRSGRETYKTELGEIERYAWCASYPVEMCYRSLIAVTNTSSFVGSSSLLRRRLPDSSWDRGGAEVGGTSVSSSTMYPL
eukprot:scaffold1315_cov217-Chaetoceros_neogracile.AAC.10